MMTIQQTDSYLVRCDFPDCKVDTGYLGDYGAYGSEGEALEDWQEHEAYAGKLGTYCPEHTIYDPDDEDGDDDGSSYRPMLPTIENLFVLAQRRIDDRIERAVIEARARLNERCRSWERRDASVQRRIDVRVSQLMPMIGSWHFAAQAPIILGAIQQARSSHPSLKGPGRYVR